MKISIILLCAWLLISCESIKKNPIPDSGEANVNRISTQISYVLFSISQNGYGFNILKDGKIYIHQPIIPSASGFHPFAKKDDAEKLAKLIITKLNSGNYKFLLQKAEVDLPIGQSKKTSSRLDEVALANVFPEFLTEPNVNVKSQSIPNRIAVLPDKPLKDKWTSKENVPFGQRAGSFSFTMGKFVFIGSGEFEDAIIRDFWCYNSSDETWTCLAEIPVSCFSGIAFSIANKGYAGLGTEIGTSSGKFKNHMYQYDPQKNDWKKINNFPGTGRIDAASFVIEGKAYVGTGYDGTNTSDFYEYNAKTDQWKRIADFGGGRVHASIGISTGKRGFLVAGAYAPNDFKFVYEYIPAKNKWEERVPFPGASRYFLSGNSIDSNFLIAGAGGASGGYSRFRDFYLYDVNNDTWHKVGDYPALSTGSTRALSGTVNGKIFMGTGYGANYMNDWQVFEHYFTVRTQPGDYDEKTGYPLNYNGKWELYQECNGENCFAGIELKSSQALGDLLYNSRYDENNANKLVKTGTGKTFALLPRNFVIKVEKSFKSPVYLRLFLTKKEVITALDEYNKKTGVTYSLNDLCVLQCNEDHPDLTPLNNEFDGNGFKLIKPQWYCYGFNGEVLVAEFSVNSLQSEFYIAFATK